MLKLLTTKQASRLSFLTDRPLIHSYLHSVCNIQAFRDQCMGVRYHCISSLYLSPFCIISDRSLLPLILNGIRALPPHNIQILLFKQQPNNKTNPFTLQPPPTASYLSSSPSPFIISSLGLWCELDSTI